MAKERTYTLKEPVTLGESDKAETVTHVTITRKLKYLRNHTLRAGADADGGVSINIDFGTLIDLGSKMIGHPPAVLDEMCEADQAVIMQEASDFLFNALGTGKPESPSSRK